MVSRASPLIGTKIPATGLPLTIPMRGKHHEEIDRGAVSLFERYAKGGEDAKLKDWAGKTLPALQHHLEMAQAMDKNRK